MKQLQFYIDNIDSNLLNSISGKPGELVKAIKNRTFLNEGALEAHFCNGASKWEHQNFLNIKARTKRILSAYFLMNPPKTNVILVKQARRCRKLYLLGISFIDAANRKEGRKLLQQAFRIAEKHDFTGLAYNCASELMASVAIDHHPAKFRHFSNRMEELLDDLKAEENARKYYFEVIMKTNAQRGPSYDFINERIQQLEQYQCTTVRYIEHYYMLCVLRDSQAHHHHTLRQSAKAALHLLRNKRGVYGSTLQFFSKHQALAHTALREYPSAEALLTSAEQYAPPRSFNRGILYYYQAFNALHSRQYELAHNLYREHRNTPYTVLAEQWTIMGAYLYFLKRAGYLGSGAERFSVGKYLNETAPTAHDKLGSNVNIIIGELLVYLVKSRDRYIDRVDSVRNYIYKYLDTPATRRANHLLRILCLLPRANFDVATLRHLGQKHFDILEKENLRDGENLTLEFIPYDDLLEIMEKALKLKVA